jgi:hypothetical protein
MAMRRIATSCPPDRFAPLPTGLRRRLEAAYCTDLSDVRVHAGPSASAIAAEAGGRACALAGREIFLGEVPSTLMPAVLAHEVAHLVQQRLPWDGAPAAIAEAEARNACVAALAGHFARPRIAADAHVPACWEEAGHYYTVYYVMLACGVEPELARRVAFWCQMPDEVSELDAVKAGINIALRTVAPGAMAINDMFLNIRAGARSVMNTLENAYVELDNRIRQIYGAPGGGVIVRDTGAPATQQIPVSIDVQIGLHALSGGSSAVETAGRRAILMGIDPRRHTFEYGIALHLFGDSYAHRTSDGTMFVAPIGHGLESLLARGGSDRHVHPDGIGPYRRDEYEAYVGDLYDIFLATFRTTPPPRREARRDVVIRSLSNIVAADDRAADSDATRDAQIALIRAGAAAFGGMHPYAPERVPDVPLSEFQAPHGISVTGWHVNRALHLARYWSQPAVHFTGAGALSALP